MNVVDELTQAKTYEQHMAVIVAAYDADAQASLLLDEAQKLRQGTARDLRFAYQAFADFLNATFAEQSTTDPGVLMDAWQANHDFQLPRIPWHQLADR
jgi:hypothetical protein